MEIGYGVLGVEMHDDWYKESVLEVDLAHELGIIDDDDLRKELSSLEDTLRKEAIKYMGWTGYQRWLRWREDLI